MPDVVAPHLSAVPAPRRCDAGIAGALLLSLLLGGCAGTAAPRDDGVAADATAASDAVRAQRAAPGRDLVTESDETPERKRARIRLALAMGYLEQSQATIALDEIKQALSIDPEFADAHNLRGLVYLRLGDARLAEQSFLRAIALKPRDGALQHNYGWLLCEQKRYEQANDAFNRALANPEYANRSKTLMARGLCEERAGQLAEAERSLLQSYELDAGNPITGYNLARLLHARGEDERARFYIRRLNNSELANAESFWLGIKVEQRLNNREAVLQLADQLRRRFSQSAELRAYEEGRFNE